MDSTPVIFGVPDLGIAWGDTLPMRDKMTDAVYPQLWRHHRPPGEKSTHFE